MAERQPGVDTKGWPARAYLGARSHYTPKTNIAHVLHVMSIRTSLFRHRQCFLFVDVLLHSCKRKLSPGVSDLVDVAPRDKDLSNGQHSHLGHIPNAILRFGTRDAVNVLNVELDKPHSALRESGIVEVNLMRKDSTSVYCIRKRCIGCECQYLFFPSMCFLYLLF